MRVPACSHPGHPRRPIVIASLAARTPVLVGIATWVAMQSPDLAAALSFGLLVLATFPASRRRPPAGPVPPQWGAPCGPRRPGHRLPARRRAGLGRARGAARRIRLSRRATHPDARRPCRATGRVARGGRR